MRWLLLCLLFPLLELTVLIRAGSRFSALWVIGALVLAALLGGVIIRTAGRNSLNRMRDDLGAKRMPEMDMLSSVLLFFSGVLFILPGFISDFFALLLLLPITRNYAAHAIVNHLRNRQNATGQTYTHGAPNGFTRVFFYSSGPGFQRQSREQSREFSNGTVIDLSPGAPYDKGPDSRHKESDPDIIDCEYVEVPPKELPPSGEKR